MKKSPRVKRLLESYAEMLGGYDDKGHQWPQDEAKQKQHLFAFRNKELEEAHWTFILGDAILGIINADCYDIEYMGLHKHFCPPGREPKTKEQKDIMRKVNKILVKQEKDIAYGMKMSAERQGIFNDDTEEEDEASDKELAT